MIDLAIRHLIKEEGIRLIPYTDSEGYWTIGIGHLIDNRKGGSIPIGVNSFPITEHTARRILIDDIHRVHAPLARELPFWDDLSKVRQVVLISMAFQMGVSGLLGFKNMLTEVRDCCWWSASIEMLESKWATQTASRANRLAEAMRTNKEMYLV